MSLVRMFALLLAAVTTAPVWANKVQTTPQEFKAMEPACQAIGMGEVDGVFWAEALKRPGNRWILDKPENAMASDVTFHHYCWGKLQKFRYFSAKTEERRRWHIRGWRSEMEYVAKHANRNWAHLASVHKEIAESYLFEKRYAEAVTEANRALALKQDFAPAFIVLADAYAAIKNRAKALEVATEGLKHNPDSKPLKRRYKEQGGGMPFPDPYPRQAAGVAQAEPPAARAEQSQTAKLAPSDEEDKPEAAKIEPPAQPADNPYCRFCP